VIAGLQVVGENDQAERWGKYQREGFDITDRELSSSFGQYSRSWRYRMPRGNAVVSVDYAFRGWHELTQCYQGVGWTLRKRLTQGSDQPNAAEGFLVAAAFDRATGRQGGLLFGLDTMEGTALEPRPAYSLLESLRNRLEIFRTPRGQLGERLRSRYVAMPLCYQVQLFIETPSPLSSSEWNEARAFFAQARQAVRRKIARSNELARAGPLP
jgi:hypothetical protein